MELQFIDSSEQLAVKQEEYHVSLLEDQSSLDINKFLHNHYHENLNTLSMDKQYRCCISADRLNHLRKKVEDAILAKKTFTVKGGYHCIRNALLQRGWVEKIEIKSPIQGKLLFNGLNLMSMDEVCSNLPCKQEWESPAAHVMKCEKMIISRLLQNHDIDFYWNLRKDSNEWQHRLNKTKIINRFSRSLFTSKEGLCLLLQQMYWHNEPGIAYVRFPRCYTINFADQCTAFIDDFRLTACISLLKWFVFKIHNDGEFAIYTDKGKIPISTVQFAIDRCNDYINIQKHLDIDREYHKVWDHEWEQFLTNFQSVVHNKQIFEENSRFNLFNLENSAKIVLKNIISFWPQFELDGIQNVWIMKPGNKCRGRDIRLVKDAQDVLRVMNSKLKYVVQKYIERPLLIYKTKFDIRQWFMVTCVQPLTIWMYRDCYLRFSSQKFSLDDLHESVHLTNHAVQHKYINGERSKELPDDNMWDNHTFKTYLRQIGQAEKWYKVIYPGMRESIIGAMLASQEAMDRRPNTFELYGADFMIAENFTPWLIEINSCPAMGPTTSVTARMCPQCFEDVLKVVIDRRRDPKADTGLFELIYKQNIPHSPAYLGMTLSIRGRKLFKKRSSGKQKPDKSDYVPPDKKHEFNQTIKPKLQVELVKNYRGPIIGNLIEELNESLSKNPGQNEETRSNDSELIGNSKPIQEKRNKRVQESQLISQKPTISCLLKQNSNKQNSFLNRNNQKDSAPSRRKSSPPRKTSSKNKSSTNLLVKSSPKSANDSKYKWKHFDNKHWEQETASILKNSICLSSAPIQSSREIKLKLVRNPEFVKNNTALAMNNMLPGIENKNTTQLLSNDLLTVGLGYKNNYKTLVKENMIPLNRQHIMDKSLKLKC